MERGLFSPVVLGLSRSEADDGEIRDLAQSAQEPAAKSPGAWKPVVTGIA
jgi:hypothetical protein